MWMAGITAAGVAAVLYLGARDVQAGVLTLGELLLVLGYLGQIYSPLKTLGKKVAKPILQRLLLHETETVNEDNNGTFRGYILTTVVVTPNSC